MSAIVEQRNCKEVPHLECSGGRNQWHGSVNCTCWCHSISLAHKLGHPELCARLNCTLEHPQAQ